MSTFSGGGQIETNDVKLPPLYVVARRRSRRRVRSLPHIKSWCRYTCGL